MDMQQQRGKRIRGWHRCFVFISCYMVMVHHFGFFFSTGTLFVDMMTAFNSTRAETAVIQSTASAVYFGSGVVVGALVSKIGLVMAGILGSTLASVSLMACFFASSMTYLIICIGVLNGLGRACLYITSTAVIREHFKGRKQSLFMSILVSGSGIGGMVFPYLVRYLSDLYGFRGTLLLIGAVGMNTIPGCFLWQRKMSSKEWPKINAVATSNINEFQSRFQIQVNAHGENIKIGKRKQKSSDVIPNYVYVSEYPVLQDKNKTKTVIIQPTRNTSTHMYINQGNKQTVYSYIKRLMQNKIFILFAFGSALVIPSFILITTFTADIFLNNGLTKDDVSLGFFLFNMMALVGRLLPGFLLQCRHITLLSVPVFCATLTAVEIFIQSSIRSRWSMIILTGALGTQHGMFVAMVTIIGTRLVDKDLLPTAIGMLFTSNAVGPCVTGPVSGYIKDVTGSYSIPFYICAAIDIVGAAVFLIALVIRRRESQKLKRQSPQYLQIPPMLTVTGVS